jgi:hypothetical protein
MRAKPRSDRKAFRPSMIGAPLEERVVLSSTPVWMTFLRGPAGGPSGPSDPSGLTARDLATTYNQQFNAARDALRQFVHDQIATLYGADNLGPNGRPTQEALAAFNHNVAGALNATALGLSSQVALLPGSAERLIPTLQQSLLGDDLRSLAGRVGRQIGTPWGISSPRLLQNSLDRLINSNFATGSRQVSVFLRSPGLASQAIDPTTGLQVPLSQYIGTQAAQQLNNTFGTLANSVGPLAQSTLFDPTGAFNAQGVEAFRQQYANALNTAAYQANGILSILPNSSPIRSQLQSSFFGTGTGGGTGTPTGNFFNALTGVFPTGTGPNPTPFTMNEFNTAFQNGFTSAFQNFNGVVGPFLNGGTPGSGGGTQLPSGFFQNGATFPSVFGPQFTGGAFNNGFNNGFATTGTGFPGFGTAPTGFNQAFGTGFNNFITNVNSLGGITGPLLGTPGTGTGSGTIGGEFGGLTPGSSTGTGTGTGTGTVGGEFGGLTPG